MPSFSKTSEARLATCHPDLIKVMSEVIKRYDFTILEGYRSKELQEQLFKEGKSRVQFPKSKHNQWPSLAVDIAPYPIDWSDHARFTELAKIVILVASELGVRIRWGNDWNMDGKPDPATWLHDFPHFELVS